VAVDDLLAAAVALADAVAVEEHADGAAEAGLPVLGLHLGAVGAQPRDVGQRRALLAADGRPSKKRLRRNVGCSRATGARAAVNSTSGWSTCSQSTQ
jgi:hypothetical protein